MYVRRWCIAAALMVKKGIFSSTQKKAKILSEEDAVWIGVLHMAGTFGVWGVTAVCMRSAPKSVLGVCPISDHLSRGTLSGVVCHMCCLAHAPSAYVHTTVVDSVNAQLVGGGGWDAYLSTVNQLARSAPQVCWPGISNVLAYGHQCSSGRLQPCAGAPVQASHVCIYMHTGDGDEGDREWSGCGALWGVVGSLLLPPCMRCAAGRGFTAHGCFGLVYVLLLAVTKPCILQLCCVVLDTSSRNSRSMLWVHPLYCHSVKSWPIDVVLPSCTSQLAPTGLLPTSDQTVLELCVHHPMCFGSTGMPVSWHIHIHTVQV